MRFVQAQQGAEAHHRALTPDLADHLSRHRHIARRADDRLRLRTLPLRPIRATRGCARRSSSRPAADGTRCSSTPGPTCARRRCATRIRRVDAILFTHGHADHILGIDDVRRFNALMKRPMPCYGDARTLDDIRQTFHYVFDPAHAEGRRPAAARADARSTGPCAIGDLDGAADAALARPAADPRLPLRSRSPT